MEICRGTGSPVPGRKQGTRNKKKKKIVYIPGTWYQVGSLPRTGITYENEYEVHCDVPRTCDQAFLLFVVVAVCCCCCAHLFIWR